MITKERLEELIEKGADIWKIEDGKVYPLRKDHYQYWNIKEDRLQWYCKIVPSGYCYISFNHLFETKEDAEEYAEFGNITITERLELPSWEEFNKVSTFTFKRKDGTDMEIAIWHNCPDDDCKTIKITRSYDWTACCFEKPLTRENYNEARRLCVKLFKGEK